MQWNARTSKKCASRFDGLTATKKEMVHLATTPIKSHGEHNIKFEGTIDSDGLQPVDAHDLRTCAWKVLFEECFSSRAEGRR